MESDGVLIIDLPFYKLYKTIREYKGFALSQDGFWFEMGSNPLGLAGLQKSIETLLLIVTGKIDIKTIVYEKMPKPTNKTMKLVEEQDGQVSKNFKG